VVVRSQRLRTLVRFPSPPPFTQGQRLSAGPFSCGILQGLRGSMGVPADFGDRTTTPLRGSVWLPHLPRIERLLKPAKRLNAYATWEANRIRDKDVPYGPDHTYVESSHGHVWPCWGRSSKGRSICDGDANTMQADCLSVPNSRAGIDYGRTRRVPGWLPTRSATRAIPDSSHGHALPSSQLLT
jgi:hypothetical protein